MKDPASGHNGRFGQARLLEQMAGGHWSHDIVESPTVCDARDPLVRDLAKKIEKGLGTKLRDLLQARVDESSTAHRRGRRLINSKVPRVRAGSLDVFRRNEETDELSTAVHILCDMSGSMFGVTAEGMNAISAAAACYAVGTILDKFQIPFAWTNFGSSAQSVKSFKARWRTRRNASCIQGLGGTVLDAPLLRLMPELCARDEQRKLCLVMTDGDPSDVETCVSVLDTLQMLEAEIAVLFIGTDGHEFQTALAECGIMVARARTQADLAQGVFSAIENAF